MADADGGEFSLLSLGDELTCSICLCTFDCPVTTPCGHNFCQQCLLSTWKETYSCPQCRAHYSIKPELKKNTVLSAVVDTFKLRSTDVSVAETAKSEAGWGAAAIRCDTCMKAEAVNTCLTCMASYCAEHLRPHRDSPVFRVHQLTEPVGDLLERICPDHQKLTELFCTQHDRLICTLCLQQAHKTCNFIQPEKQRAKQKSNFSEKLDLVNKKIKQNETVISQITDMQLSLKGSAATKKSKMAHVYEQIRDMLAAEERAAMTAVDQELESSQTKIRVLMKMFSDNIKSLNKAKVDIQSLLCQSQTMAFLQASLNLPKAAAFDPYAPRINFNSKKVTANEEFAVNLKKQMYYILNQPVGARPPLTDGAALSFDPKTAHKRIVLTEHFTRASVSDQLNPAAHIDCPQRFSVCTQVLTSQGFTRGCHYWEVRLNHNNFIGIGLAYGSIDRKGPTSRLGRNAKSWCVEWFNVKLSAWHDSSEIKVVNPHPKRVGVLLDCDSGSATFYNVADRVYPFYSFVFPFTEAVYPAFWLFSSESSITLCQLQA
uniref:Tripartite motif containing 25 n=1 Tax=Hippocampus comes TaxID=109280 RepID=A0A3Q2YC57_HIPCM